MRPFGIAFIALAVSYLLLVGQFSADEIGLALCGGALAALWFGALSRTADIRFRFEWKAIVTVLDAVAAVPVAAARVTWLLVRAGRRRPRGSIGEQPFEHGRDRDAADATRRAAVLLAISLAPDRYALLHEDDRLSTHRLAAGPSGGDKRWPA
jgi:multisubunit Na+/H+ antiporter MnhE subunit